MALQIKHKMDQLKRLLKFARAVKPVFTPEAMELLNKSYVALRSNDASAGNKRA